MGVLSQRESFALASGMNARGSTEVIIATIGLSMGVLSQNLFSMIVTMAIKNSGLNSLTTCRGFSLHDRSGARCRA